MGGGDGWSTIPLKSMHNDLVQVWYSRWTYILLCIMTILYTPVLLTVCVCVCVL